MPDADALAYLSAAELGRLYRARELSPVEATRAHLERIGRYDPTLRCFVVVTAESALAEAQRAEAELRRGEDRGPLHGIPVAVKDLYDQRGLPTTAGSPILAERVADRDADAVERLHAAGAVLLGKTNLHEWAFGATTANPHFGTTRNPWNRQRIPGGSSGGSAAAVAAGMAPLALGTDTGGSIRQPASYCGIVGLKPTYGLCSRYGLYPDAWDLDHSGPYGRDARDAALLLGVLAGHDPRDPRSARRPPVDYAAELARDVRGLRVGLLTQQIDLATPPLRDALLAAARTLEGLGMSVQEARLPHEADSIASSTVIMFAEMASHHLPWLRSRIQDYGPDVRERFELGVLFSGASLVKAQRVRALLLREARAALQQVDVLLTATTPYPAPTLAEALTKVPPQIRFTRLWNMMGFPALSAPCGYGDDGLPLGMQLVGRPWEDGLVLRVAHAYQQASGTPDWSRRRPPLEAAASA